MTVTSFTESVQLNFLILVLVLLSQLILGNHYAVFLYLIVLCCGSMEVAGSCVFIICWRLFVSRTSSQPTYSSVQQAFSRSLTLVWREFSRMSQIDRTVTRWPLVGTGLQNCYTLPRNMMRALTFGTDDFMLVLGLW